MQADVSEIVLGEDPRVCGDTFIFEPAAAERHLGRLFVAIETEERGSAGSELIEKVINALQREYYRDPTRRMLPSLESALHQANLVLHEAAEQGQREWMRSWHAAVGVLAKTTLHVSTAGEGKILLARQNRLTSIASGLSHSPITDPLRTFSQVASGVVGTRDVLFFGSAALTDIFHAADLTRLVIDYSSNTIALRLKQLYEDQRAATPVAVVVVALLPEHLAASSREPLATPARAPLDRNTRLTPRQPLLIYRSLLQRLVMLSGRLVSHGWQQTRERLWPALKAGSRRSGAALYQVSRSAKPLVQAGRGKINWQHLRGFFTRLPRSSKWFALLVLILAVALLVSLVLLRQKRIADESFQQTSERLHEARTKKEAAETALIYNNRDQARGLLAEAGVLAESITQSGLYQEEVATLASEITAAQDRLDKVTRADAASLKAVGDFSAVLGSATLTNLFYLEDSLYTFNPADNTLAKMSASGVAEVVSHATQGVGFFTGGAAHEADKSLVLMTDAPGAALYDAKTRVVQKQDIALPAPNSSVSSVATFGNRVYVFDQTTKNIYGYTKTLRGYSGGEVWLTAQDFPRETITDLGVDGYIYTLHSDGSVRKLLKGSPVEFTLEELAERLSPESRLYISEELDHLYFFDPPRKRVVIFDTVGNLSRQIYLHETAEPRDIAITPDETTLYVLDGSRVFALPLAL